MSHREGTSREELIRLNLEELIARDNPVRLIDAYVDSLGLEELGFSHVVPAETGSPPYHPGDLLKLYIYGYEHRLRSSRQLSWACCKFRSVCPPKSGGLTPLWITYEISNVKIGVLTVFLNSFLLILCGVPWG